MKVCTIIVDACKYSSHTQKSSVPGRKHADVRENREWLKNKKSLCFTRTTVLSTSD